MGTGGYQSYSRCSSRDSVVEKLPRDGKARARKATEDDIPIRNQEPDGWLSTMRPIVQTLDDYNHIVSFQKLCGISRVKGKDVAAGDGRVRKCCSSGARYRVKNRFLHCFFQLACYGGEEIMFFILFPIIGWGSDPYTLRRVSWMFSAAMYITTLAKDFIGKDRPPSPPVFRLEARSAGECTLPSTHAVAATAVSIPFLVNYWHRHLYYYPNFVWNILVAITVLYIASVCLSRIYNGMHSFFDVLCGVGVTCLLMKYILQPLDSVVEGTLTSEWGPVILLTAGLLVSFAYPPTESWNTGRGDSITLVGTNVGLFMGCWLNFVLGTPYDDNFISHPGQEFTMDGFLLLVMRLLVGLPIVILVRAPVRYLFIRFFCAVIDIDYEDPKSTQNMVIETLYKYFSYVVIAASGTFLVPQIFPFLGL